MSSPIQVGGKFTKQNFPSDEESANWCQSSVNCILYDKKNLWEFYSTPPERVLFLNCCCPTFSGSIKQEKKLTSNSKLFRRSFDQSTKQGLVVFTKHLLFGLLSILTAIPIAAKGASDQNISSNMFSGFTRIGDNQQLFMQENYTTTRAQSGATAALHCALASPLADGLVSWVRRRDYHLLTVGRQVYSSDQRMGVKVSPDGRNWILMVRWVDPHDAGQYECQVSSHPPQSLMVNLSVVDAHAEILGGRERYIHSGSSLRLVCLLRDATEPPVYVFWYRGSRMINYDTEREVTVDNSREASVLYMASVISHDEGNYTCLPSNAAPASVTVHIVKRENHAGLQQETLEYELKSSFSAASSSSPSSALKKLSPQSTSSYSYSSATPCVSEREIRILCLLVLCKKWHLLS